MMTIGDCFCLCATCQGELRNGERGTVLGMGAKHGSVIGNRLDPKSQLSGNTKYGA